MKIITIIAFFIVTVYATSNKDPHFRYHRTTIVHLFEWKWKDVANECENFLQYKGYGGVQISPPTENVIVPNRPWWEKYQPISYKLESRSGNEDEFRDMTERCNAVGVRIYADVILNHMNAEGYTQGTGGSVSDPQTRSYPAVPYNRSHFHDACDITNYNNAAEVRNCELLKLPDLNQGIQYVRRQMIEFLNHLIDLGVAGFRIDAATHMWPSDLDLIYTGVKDLNTSFGFRLGDRPFIYQEVIDMGDTAIHREDYTPLGVVTEFRYSSNIGRVFRGWDKLTYLSNWGPGWSFIPDGNDALVFVDNHDNQRGHGAGGDTILTYKMSKQYKMAVAFMLAHPYGISRVMSSYYFDNADQGPPHDDQNNIITPMIEDDICKNGWVCEHRWRQIYNMVIFKNAVQGTNIENWWSNGDQRIAFSRGGLGFIAFTNSGDLNEYLKTGLPPGNYCDIISGGLVKDHCTGKVITVDDSNSARIILNASEYDGVLAIFIDAKL